MSSNEPKDPNAPNVPSAEADPQAAVAAAEAALAQARAAAQAAAAARARAEALSRPGEVRPKAAPKSAESDPTVIYVATGGEERAIVDASARPRMSRVALATGFGTLAIAAGTFVFLMTNAEAKTRMDKAFAGNSCGDDGKASCLAEHVLGPKFAMEKDWREEDSKSKPIYGSLDLTYEPMDATVEMYQIRYKLSADEWKRGVGGIGTKVCEKGADGKEICEVPYKAWDGLEDGICKPDKQLTEMPPITGRPLTALRQSFVPIFEAKRSCEGADANGQVSEVYNYEYRLVFSHKDFETKSVYLSKSAWTPNIGPYTLAWPGINLVPKPQTMLDEFVKFRSDLFCYMKRKKLEADKVPASVVDALRTQNGFVTIELYDRTEALITTPEHKAWWDERWKEIEALKCEE